MNGYAEFGEKLAAMKGWDEDAIEILENGFSMNIDPLEHDESDYRELERIMPAMARDMLEFSVNEAAGILGKMNRRLQRNGLPPQGTPDSLDDIRDAIGDAFSALDEIGKDNDEYPDYDTFQVEVRAEEKNGKTTLYCDFNGADVIGMAIEGEKPGKAIDRLYENVFGEKEKAGKTPKP